MTWTTSTLAICAALILGVSACKAGDAGATQEKPAEKEPATPAAGADADKPADTPADKPADTPADTPPAAGASVAGTYTSGAVTLAITNVSAAQFDFHVSSPAAKGDDDGCGGLDYKGTARFDASDPAKATTEFDGSMRFAAGSVTFEPSMEMIGNECARSLDVEFKRAAK
ncbi:MAG: hypothetical protein R3B09_31990 [Nannocystaceae bacterium]